MKAYLTESNSLGGIQAQTVTAPEADSIHAIVKVSHFSLNRGELHFARSGAPHRPIGWDIAGTVLHSPNGGPEIGSRVVGFCRASRGWAEKVAIPLADLAPIPESVGSSQAASLPVAALTALYSLERGRRLLGSRVLVTGATGGVGSFAVSLASLMGCEVVAQVRRFDQVQAVEALGADKVVVDEQGQKVAEAGPFRVIVDGLGNRLTSRVIHSLTPDGTAVIYGATDKQQLELEPGFLLGTGTGRVEGFNLYRESEIESVARGLTRLLKLVERGRLKVQVEREVGWAEAPQLAQDLMDRKFAGKAVVRV